MVNDFYGGPTYTKFIYELLVGPELLRKDLEHCLGQFYKWKGNKIEMIRHIGGKLL